MNYLLQSQQFGNCSAAVNLGQKEITEAYSLNLARNLDEFERHLLACEFAEIFYQFKFFLECADTL